MSCRIIGVEIIRVVYIYFSVAIESELIILTS